MDILEAIASYVRGDTPELQDAYLARAVILVELVLPPGGRAFQRIAVTASGDPMLSWEVDGFLVKGLRLTQPDETL